MSPPADFESAASTSSAIPAGSDKPRIIRQTKRCGNANMAAHGRARHSAIFTGMRSPKPCSRSASVPGASPSAVPLGQSMSAPVSACCLTTGAARRRWSDPSCPHQSRTDEMIGCFANPARPQYTLGFASPPSISRTEPLKLRIKKIDHDARLGPRPLRNRAIAEKLNRLAPGAPSYNVVLAAPSIATSIGCLRIP